MRFKPTCSATETSLKFEILLVVSLDMILSNKGVTKALVRLGGAGWSAPLLFLNSRRQVFSQRGPYVLGAQEEHIELFLLRTQNPMFDRKKYDHLHFSR